MYADEIFQIYNVFYNSLKLNFDINKKNIKLKVKD